MNLSEINQTILDDLIDVENSHVEKCQELGILPLYDYQQEGLDAIINARRGRFILADAPGLGKTLQTLAAIKSWDPEKTAKILVIATKNSKPVWRNECRKWLKEEVTVLDSQEMSAIEITIALMNPPTRIVVCNYEQLKDLVLLIQDTPWDIIVCDEVHKIRNPKAAMSKATTKIVTAFPTSKLVLLTGTPLVNTPEDLFSLLHLIDPFRFDSCSRWINAWFYKWGTSYRHKNVDAFQTHVKPYMLRRESKDVLNLPPIKRVSMPIEMTAKQRKLYKEVNDAWLMSIEGQEDVPITNLLAQITRLKQICLDPSLIVPDGEITCEGAKTTALINLLEELQGKVVVCSSFARHLRALKKRLEAEGYVVGIITAKENEQARDNTVKAFQDPENPMRIILISSKAGGESITLTQAATFIHLDKPWTAAEEEQAFGRVWRIGAEGVAKKEGQVRRVWWYYLKVENSVEEYIEKVIGRKRDMFGQSVPVSLIRRLMAGG
jgi:SWI/SNF-related matrix-associated actin-dependent regulator of chromatin subfamily A member 5